MTPSLDMQSRYGKQRKLQQVDTCKQLDGSRLVRKQCELIYVEHKREINNCNNMSRGRVKLDVSCV